jgi:transcription elongation factor GreA-like protein
LQNQAQSKSQLLYWREGVKKLQLRYHYNETQKNRLGWWEDHYLELWTHTWAQLVKIVSEARIRDQNMLRKSLKSKTLSFYLPSVFYWVFGRANDILKSISSCAEYVTLQKYLSQPRSLVIYFSQPHP